MMEVDEDKTNYYDCCANCKKSQSDGVGMIDEIFKINSAPSCGHKFCQACINSLFYLRAQFECKVCHSMVSKDKLVTKSMEEVESERDYFIRKQLKEIFNTTEDNFKSAKEFKDYEEFVEDLIYNLVKGIDVEQTKKTIDDYKKHNLAAIANNQSTRDSRMEMEEKQIQEELQRQEKNQLAYQTKLKDEKKQREENHRKQNQVLLGEASREPATTANKGETSSAPADGAMQAQRMNPVLQLIYSRPLPEITNDKAAVVLEGNEYVRRLYAAGGYLHANYDLRNWTEIRSQLL